MITVLEAFGTGSKPQSHLSISVAVREGESYESEFCGVRDTLLEWQKSRGAGCGAVAFKIQTAESSSAVILNLFMNIVEQDTLIKELLGNLKEGELSLVSPSGRRIKKLGFAHEPNE